MFPLPEWAVDMLGIAGIVICALLGYKALGWAFRAYPLEQCSEYERQQFRKRHEKQYWASWDADAAAKYRNAK